MLRKRVSKMSSKLINIYNRTIFVYLFSSIYLFCLDPVTIKYIDSAFTHSKEDNDMYKTVGTNLNYK